MKIDWMDLLITAGSGSLARTFGTYAPEALDVAQLPVREMLAASGGIYLGGMLGKKKSITRAAIEGAAGTLAVKLAQKYAGSMFNGTVVPQVVAEIGAFALGVFAVGETGVEKAVEKAV